MGTIFYTIFLPAEDNLPIFKDSHVDVSPNIAVLRYDVTTDNIYDVHTAVKF